MKRTLIVLLSIILINYSCKEYPCQEASVNINIYGFTKSDIDSVIVRKYVTASNFSSFVESWSMDSLQASYNWTTNNYLIVDANFASNGYGIRSKFDYEVYIPRKNRLFRITEISEEQVTGRETLSMEKRGCINPIRSYRVNGQLISGDDPYYYIALSK